MRILIIEDNPADAYLVREYLRAGDTSNESEIAERISSGIQAIAKTHFDVVLLDMSLPDGGGLEAVKRVHAVAPDLPIVILSGQQDEALAMQAVQEGAQDYLVKGHVDEFILRRALNYAIERQQLLDRLAASEGRLKNENQLLRRITDAAGRLFSMLDAKEIVRLLAAEARHLFGGTAVLIYTIADDGEVASLDGDANAQPDAFVRRGFALRGALLDGGRHRVALPIAGTTGNNEWLLDLHLPPETPFDENDVFALDILRQYIGIAIQNIALFGELESQRADVIKVNQLKDDLIAVLAHDFKGPLTSIIGFSELLMDRLVEGEEAVAALHTIHGSALRLSHLADDTLTLSRAEQGELRMADDTVDVGALVTEIANTLRGQRQIELEESVADWCVPGDAERLRQVLENIISNAIKYSPQGDAVGIKIDGDASQVRVAVSDRGIGVPEDEIQFLFDRFSRGSNAKHSAIKGTGLGLYLAGSLVRGHGGRIEVESRLNEGSTFTVVLPRHRRSSRVSFRVELISADDESGPFIVHVLRGEGYAIRRDRDFKHARKRLVAQPADCFIVDCEGDVGGLETFYQEAQDLGGSPAFVAIGGKEAEGIPWATRLPKPFLSADLLAALERVRLNLKATST